MPTLTDTDVLREYDTALITKLGATIQVDAADDRSKYMVTVDGITDPVPVVIGPAEDWWHDFRMPAIAVTRRGIVPAPHRTLTGFKAVAPSTANPGTHKAVGTVPPQPVTVIYEVEFAGVKQRDMNAFTWHQTVNLPVRGFGTFLSIFSGERLLNYNVTGMVDRSEKKTKEGRKFVYMYPYAVDAWLTATASAEVPMVATLALDVAPASAIP